MEFLPQLADLPFVSEDRYQNSRTGQRIKWDKKNREAPEDDDIHDEACDDCGSGVGVAEPLFGEYVVQGVEKGRPKGK